MAEQSLPQNGAEGLIGQVAGVERVAIAREVEGDQAQTEQEDGKKKGSDGENRE